LKTKNQKAATFDPHFDLSESEKDKRRARGDKRRNTSEKRSPTRSVKARKHEITDFEKSESTPEFFNIEL
jgi:hypothetical protein